ncbi:MAG: hypothetical protein ACTHNS_15895 [Marmoricola sp.]
MARVDDPDVEERDDEPEDEPEDEPDPEEPEDELDEEVREVVVLAVPEATYGVTASAGIWLDREV